MASGKLIKAKLPTGFRMLVEESFNGLSGERIFIFENEKKQRIYAKLCEPEDLVRGFIWHILSPSELRLLEIQESYNETVYGEGKTIEESVPEDELWNPEQETIEQYKARTGRDPKKGSISAKGIKDLASKAGEVNIYVSGQKEGENPSAEELQVENEDLKNKLSLIAHKEFNVRAKNLRNKGYTGRLETIDDLKEAEAEIESDPIKKKSSGTLSLESNLSGGSHGYDSYEEMIDDLQRRKRSKNATEREEATKILNELMRKAIAGKKQKDFETNVEGGEEATIEGFKKEYRKRKEGVD